jgi:hypothetical protein
MEMFRDHAVLRHAETHLTAHGLRTTRLTSKAFTVEDDHPAKNHPQNSFCGRRIAYFLPALRVYAEVSLNRRQISSNECASVYQG